MSETTTNGGAEPLRVKTKKHKKHKSSSRSHTRSYSEERLYHGAVVGDDFLDGRPEGQPAPTPSATTAGPLRGENSRVGVGGWGTLNSVDSAPNKGSGTVIEAVGVGVATADGRKRDVRGGESEDAFAAVVDVLGTYVPPSTAADKGKNGSGVAVVAVEVEDEAETGTATAAPSIAGRNEDSGEVAAAAAAAAAKTTTEGGRQQISSVVTVGDRVFHLFGVYDGHRSNHAARFCAEALGPEITRRLQTKGLLRPIGVEAKAAAGGDAGGAKEVKEEVGEEEEEASEEAAAAAEEAAIAEAFKQAVVRVDDDFCSQRWVSLVRDNGKKFYLTRVQGVPLDFDMPAWDAYPLEHAWRSALASFSDAHGRRSVGLSSEHDLRLFVQQQQERWHCYKKELYPGCALCAVLVDAHRGKLYCANTGDCGALLFSTRHSTPPADPTTTADSASKPPPPTTTAVPTAAVPTAKGNDEASEAHNASAPSSFSLSSRGTLLSGAEVLNGQGAGGAFTVGFPDNGNKGARDDSDSDGDGDDGHDGDRQATRDKVVAGALAYGLRGVSGKRFSMLSRPHKPADMAELVRVCNTPRGFVEVHGQRVMPSNSAEVADQVALAHSMGRKALYRINRDVSLSRAMGDLDLKEFGVTAEPDVTVYELASGGESQSEKGDEGGESLEEVEGEEFTVVLAIASDGIWDVISPRECASMLDSSSDISCLVSGGDNAKAGSSSVATTSDEKENESLLVPSPATTDLASPSKLQASTSTSTSRSTTATPATAASAAGAAASSLARALVDAAVAITKNNDDVTAVVAALTVRPHKHPANLRRIHRRRLGLSDDKNGASSSSGASTAAAAAALARASLEGKRGDGDEAAELPTAVVAAEKKSEGLPPTSSLAASRPAKTEEKAAP